MHARIYRPFTETCWIYRTNCSIMAARLCFYKWYKSKKNKENLLHTQYYISKLFSKLLERQYFDCLIKRHYNIIFTHLKNNCLLSNYSFIATFILLLKIFIFQPNWNSNNLSIISTLKWWNQSSIKKIVYSFLNYQQVLLFDS
jgi:hypothetical protein